MEKLPNSVDLNTELPEVLSIYVFKDQIKDQFLYSYYVYFSKHVGNTSEGRSSEIIWFSTAFTTTVLRGALDLVKNTVLKKHIKLYNSFFINF